MSKKKYDLIVIGGGSAGVRASRWAAARGVKTLLVEKSDLGGTCVVRGCVPKKIMVMAAQFQDEQVLQKSFGWSGEAHQHSWPTLKANRDQEVQRLVEIYGRLLQNSKVEVVHGSAKLSGADQIEVEGEHFDFEHLIIATGGRPERLQIQGAEFADTSDEFFYWQEVPKRVCVVGGGYIALELAGVLNAFGAKVDLVCRSPQVLGGFDAEVRTFVQEELQNKGLQIHASTELNGISKLSDHLSCSLSSGGSLKVDKVLLAVGRAPNTEGLELNLAGVDLRPDGRIRVNDDFQTLNQNIYAIGDVANQFNLTPVALHEAMWLIEHLYGQTKPTPFSYEAISTAVFSQPEVATCGLSEEQASKKGIRTKIFSADFYSMKQVIGGRREKSFIKMVVDRDSDQVLGIHLVGSQSAEIMQGFAIAVKLGLKKYQIDQVVGLHPTIAEELVTMRTFREGLSDRSSSS